MPTKMTIGIIGGMGPQATNRLCEMISGMTLATCDQDHIPVLSFNNSAIPNRVAAILEDGTSPLPELIRTATILEAAGADFLLMPCNTAHFFIDALQAAVSIQIVDMLQSTVQFIHSNYPQLETIGVIASTPTLECQLYGDLLQRNGYKTLVPSSLVQEQVMNAIFSESGIKAGFTDKPREVLIASAEHLIDMGAQAIIAGCTEVSLVLKAGDFDAPLIDPLAILAALAVERASGYALDLIPQVTCGAS